MSPGRRQIAIELAICTVMVTALSLYGLARMDYFDPDHRDDVRMTDNTRTAYVAKNIAEGRGYVTDELPTFLIDFYDKQGMLHDADWVNADRFPFTAYAIAALYTVTRSTSWEVGILGYNLVTFVGFMVLLYWFTRVVWNDRWPALLALAIALVHPLTYIYLYLKDADMMLLTAGVLLCLWRYLERPAKLPIWRSVLTGTLLAWLVLARPQIGGGFVVAFAVLGLVRGHRLRKAEGWKPALRSLLRNEGIVGAAVIVWMMPFIIHSLSVWHSPLFSANALYQRPLGTRFVMNTDTWWKYTEPGMTFGTGTLWELARNQLLAKFTTSWEVTVRLTIAQFPVELALTTALLVWLGRRARALPADASPDDPDADALADERARTKRVRTLGTVVGAVVLMNLALLPLYGSHHYGYRHYLSFFLVFLWPCCGRALLEIGRIIWPAMVALYNRAKPHWPTILLVFLAALVAWNFNRRGQYTSHLFVRGSDFVGAHWIGCVVTFAAILWGRAVLWIRPWRRGVLFVALLVWFRYTPYLETKRLNLAWLPDDKHVWDVLREEHGLVTSFAMQNEVGWASGRQNFPAPELPMHVYSFLQDHQLEIQDIYIESPEAIAGPDGAFYYAAPGFEGYRRLEQFQGTVPGYKIVFHASAMRGYPRYKIKARQKSSLVYRLTDRAAVQAMLRSPDKLELGSVANVIYTAHGWGDYFQLDGKPAVAATAGSRQRYRDLEPTDRPYEDTGATFFLDDARRPTSVDLEIYATHTATLDFFWNNDLYFFNTPTERAKHAVGSYKITKLGWQTVHLAVPPGVLRTGLNKLGFRSSEFQAVAICPPEANDGTCTTAHLEALEPGEPELVPSTIVRDATATSTTAMWISVFVGTLTFHYDRTPS